MSELLAPGDCPSLAEYIEKAPADKISLVFATENVAHPASMMGHVSLLIQGVNDDGQSKQHIVSFFTQIDGINVLRLLIESFFTGMQSFFSLGPADRRITQYQAEGRNVWIYRLSLSEESRQFIHLNLWELKHLDAEYLFVGYNCATVLVYVLAIANPAVWNDFSLWITPLDVVTKAQRVGLVESRNFLPSEEWLVRALTPEFDEEVSHSIFDLARGSSSSDLQIDEIHKRVLAAKLGSSLAVYLHKQGGIKAETLATRIEYFDKLQGENLKVEYDFGALGDPLRRKADSQLDFGVLKINDSVNLFARFLGASHRFTDQQDYTIGESSLRLGDILVSFEPDDSQVSLQKFTFFSSTSLLPRNPLIGGLSGHFEFGLDQRFDHSLSRFKAGHVSVAGGVAYQIGGDILLYALPGLEGVFGDGQSHASATVESGALVDTLFDTKTAIRWRGACSDVSDIFCYQSIQADLAIFSGKDYALVSSLEHIWSGSNSTDELLVGLRYYF